MLTGPALLSRFSLAALLALAGMPKLALAQSPLPTGGHVVAGSASIGAPVGSTLTVNQGSSRAVVNWNSFSVGQPNAVDFVQPGSSAAILNRVTGTTPSSIAGQVNANGQVYLVNPNGIAITPSGSVQVGGGFVATTLGITNGNFMSGNLAFSGNGASAGVSNAGSITAGPGGYVALVGGTAANSGLISVPLGRVALGSGEAATLDLNGDGFMQVAAPSGTVTAKGQALVSNSGRIEAAGGTVEMSAATVAGAIRNAVNMSGVVAANSISGHDGSITLSGGPGGAVNVTGTLDASAAPSYSGAGGGNGGRVVVDGARVRLGHRAVINASGAMGGSVLVGATAPGGVDEAGATVIANGATILAAGNAAVAGSGGYIETSGGTLKLGAATISAGKGGTWLMDPTDLTIDANAATTISNALNNNNDVVEETTGTGTAGSGNMSNGAGDIIVNAAISWNTSNTLTLSAFNGITVNAPITVNGGGTLVLTTNNNLNGTSSGAGVLAFTPGVGSAQFTSEASGPSLFINNGTPGTGNGTQYTLIYNTGSGADGLQSLNTSSGNYALAVPVTESGTLSSPPITTFSGNFNGLGNTISNLTISDSTDTFVGLFGNNGGTISNIGLVGGSVTANAPSATVGELVGLNTNGATITNAYATGTVSGGGEYAGGLVGENVGKIIASYATGVVNGSSADAGGGLVGLNFGSAAISNSYATGAVTDTSLEPDLGGLVGMTSGTITDAYATGAVTGATRNAILGGLVGYNLSGIISNAYATGAVSGSGNVGGLIGVNFNGTITNGYWDSTTTGANAGVAAGPNPTHSVTTAGLATASVLAALNGSGAVWGNVNNQVTPYLLSNPGPVYLATDSSPTPAAYTLVFTPVALQNINNNLAGNFALAQNLDMTGVANWSPIGESTAFAGNFNGLGNTISNLTIIDGSNLALGLFGNNGGTISNIGLVGGSVTSGIPAVVGGLVGTNSGTITNAYATGAVSGGQITGGLVGTNDGTITNSLATGAVSSSSYVGGLVGINNGTISNSFATGAVAGTASAAFVGGLVGVNSGGTITDAYATGAVTGDDGSSIGGLVGGNYYSFGTITDAYATGAVSGGVGGGTDIGGLVGFNSSGTITDGYYDASTTGRPLGTQGDGSVGMTTAALQAALPTFQNAGSWAIIPGISYPYLTAFYPSPPQVISGFAFKDDGVTPLASPSGITSGTIPANGIVSALLNDTSLGSVTTGANGYYYFLEPAGTISSGGSALLTYTTQNASSGAANGATVISATGSVTGLTIWGNTLIAPTADTTYSTATSVSLENQDDALIVAAVEPNNNAIANLVVTLAHSGYIATGPSFTIDTPINQSAGVYIQTTAGAPLTVDAPVTIGGANGLTLDAAGALTVNQPITMSGAGAAALSGTSVAFTPINGSAYTLLYDLGTDATGLQSIDSTNDAGNYALAIPLTATGTYGAPLAGQANAFTGNFNGLGNTIANLTITDNADANVGLFGVNNGTISNIGVVGGSVTSTISSIARVGGLVGTNNGVVIDAYATGPVTGVDADAGGLVGTNTGTIADSYATGAVSAGTGYGGGLAGTSVPGGSNIISSSYATGAVSGLEAGGLVGGTYSATISDSYATGAVSAVGFNSEAGGLVGESLLGSITDAYATGAVSSQSPTIYPPGGLIGGPTSTSVSFGYYDANTTGMPLGAQTLGCCSGDTGLTTAALQAALPTFQNPGNWAIIPGVSYPYLTAFYPLGAPQVVSGIADVYKDTGMPPLASSSGIISGSPIYPTVSALLNGTSLGSVTTGANGYYYFLEPPGTIASTGAALLAYTTQNANTGAQNAASVISATGSVSGLAIWGNTLIAPTAETTYSAASATSLQSQNTALIASAVGSNSAVGTLVGNLSQYGYIATGASFTIDKPTVQFAGLYIQTIAANAPLTVDATVAIDYADALILNASGALTVNAAMTLSGASPVQLDGTSINFTPTLGSLQFTDTEGAGQTLTINGSPYTLLYNIGEVQNVNNGLGGNYALANPVDATSLGTLNTPLIGNFTGNFNGLGNTISNLTIVDPNDTTVGAFESLSGGAAISNLGLVGGSLTVTETRVDYPNVGGLVGQNNGTITDSYTTGPVTAGEAAALGGLVGSNQGSINNSYETGNVIATDAGGYVGGLVGQNFAGIGHSYATGAVTSPAGYPENQGAVGGLVGINYGSMNDVYATGAVAAPGNITGVYVGGLVGWNFNGAIIDAYATGAVSANNASFNPSPNLGGLVGYNQGTVTDGYYDSNTTGQPLGSQNGATGMTTAALQAALPTLQYPGAWSIIPGTSYPYLTAFNPSTPQVISGTAYQDSGVTPLASPSGIINAGTIPANGIVSALVNGTSLGSVTTGANGYYYFLKPAGTISGAGSAVLAYTGNGATLLSATGSVTGLPIWGNTLIAPTAATTYSAASATPLQTQDSALITTAVGSNSTAATLVAGLSQYGYIATGASFTVDTSPPTGTGTNTGLYIQTIAVNAPITVNATVAIGGGLTLNAAGALTVNAAMTESGASPVALDGTSIAFTPTLGSLQFTDTEGAGQTLTINGTPYTLLYNMGEVQNINIGLGGNYALAIPLNALTDSTTPTSWAPIGEGTAFAGNFTGLGNTIANLTINDSSDVDVGLFGQLGSGGTISNIGLIGGSVSSTAFDADVGALVGYSAATISDAYATGTVTGTASASVGGLVGTNYYGGTIANSYATGAVSGGDSRGNAGGLVGTNYNFITNAYATGAVSIGNDDAFAGGLAGANGGAIVDAYATGSVSISSGGSTHAGGLVGYNGGPISDAYATGAVSAYASGSPSVAGLANFGTITDGYYDANTTGRPLGSQGDGSVGMTTTALQAALPTFQNPGSWGIIPGVSYPYLEVFYPLGPPQVISGVAYKDAGVTPLASPSGLISGTIPPPGTVSAMVNGAGLGSVSTGANGYYYFLEPAGTISASGSAVLAYTVANANTGAVNAASVASATGSVTGLNVLGGFLTVGTTATTYSTIAGTGAALAATAAGSNSTAQGVVAGLTNLGYVASGTSFTIDAPINMTSGLYIATLGSAPLTVDATIRDSSYPLTLDAAGALTVNAALTVGGANAPVVLDGASIGFTPTLGSLEFTAAEGSGQTLTINGAGYTLLYNMGEVQNISSSGNYALAIPLNAATDSTTPMNWAPIGESTAFAGNFNGLGNTIANLTINDSTDQYVGLFGQSSGTISNIGLVGGSVTSTINSLYVGALVGENSGTITEAYATGAVSGGGVNTIAVGGLVGLNNASRVGGGQATATISNSYATGAVSDDDGANPVVGGLVGFNNANVDSAGQATATISNSYATGAVSGGDNALVGGLVGWNNAYTLFGGQATVTISNSYATGAVSGGQAASVGGLAGYNGAQANSGGTATATISSSYATGAVSAFPAGSDIAGLVGQNNGGTITNGYFAADTTGRPLGTQGDGSIGLTTTALQATLQNGFSSPSWGIIPGVSYPYLTAFYPSTPQVISGVAYQDAGVTPLASPAGLISTTIPPPATVSAMVNGAGLGSVSTGANGYYYFLEPAGTISASGSAVLAYTVANANTGAVNAASVASATGSVTGLNVLGGFLTVGTTATTYSTIAGTGAALAATAAGSNSTAQGVVAGLTNLGYVASGTSFTIDAPINMTSGLYIATLGSAPLTVDATIRDSSYPLTLDAAGALTVNAAMTVSGGAAVSLSGAPIAFTPTVGSLEFTGGPSAGATLTIGDPAGYTLIYSVAQLQAINGNLAGNYALAMPLDATGVTNWTPIGEGTAFTGNFNGLGNTISNLTITDSSDVDVGLFGQIGSTATISNIGLIGGSVTSTAGRANVGGLVANSQGTISYAYTTGAVTDNASEVYVGGLVGVNNGGTITDSHATGSVTDNASYVFIGGLAGANNGGTITDSYATGTVSGGPGATGGGLVGWNVAEATSGQVTATISDSYATGSVTATGVDVSLGGLVGQNYAIVAGGDQATATISDSYATGAVSGSLAALVGGLVGGNTGIGPATTATITDAFATGAVSASSFGGPLIAGLVGLNYGTITNGYYDADTTGRPLGPHGDGSIGLTTTQLQAALPTFQNPGNWGIIPGVSYPYLTAFYPTTPQVISGIAYQDAGVTPLASPAGLVSGTIPPSATVSALVDGTSLGSVTTGANGYYYFLEPAGTIASGGSAVLAYTTANTNTGAAYAASLISATGSVTGLTIWGNTLIAPTAATLYSAASATSLQSQNTALIASAVGSNNAVGTLVGNLSQYGYIATGASFTVDTPINQNDLNAGLYIQTTAANAPITVDATVALGGANGLTLNAAGALTVNAAMTVSGAAAVVLDGTSIAFTPTLGSLQFTDTEGSGQTLTINGTPYQLLYNIGEVQGVGSTGDYALALPVDAASLGTLSAPLIPNFSGNFNGLGNAVLNLTINDATDTFVGLFGTIGTGGTVSNIGVVGGSVTSTAGGVAIGGLVGYSQGTISDAYVTGAVTDNASHVFVGGLVGINDTGTISNSFATGTVSGGSGEVGGLVGYNGGTLSVSYATGSVSGSSTYGGGLVGANAGTITDAYATGAVSAPNAYVGGLVGINTGTIIDAYATGALSGSSSILGGLTAINFGSAIVDGYYDAGTTGLPLGPQYTGSVGLTTAALQSFEFADNTYFQNNANWGIISGSSYPYLKALYPLGAQVVSGTVFRDQGVTPATGGIAVSGLVGGNGIGTVETGANGYYYFLLQANTIPSGGGVLTYAQNYSSPPASGAAFMDGVTGGVATGLTIFATTLHEITSDTANSELQSNLAVAVGNDLTAVPLLATLSNLQIDASGAFFDVDTPISYPSGTVTLNANAITESTGTITAIALAVNSVNSVDLSGNNLVAYLAASLTASEASFDFVNTDLLAVYAAGNLTGITTNNGAVVLETTSNDIDVYTSINTVNGGSDPSVGFAGVALSAPLGAIDEFGGSIVAPAVVASAANGIDFTTLAGPNEILTFAGQVTGVIPKANTGLPLTVTTDGDLMIGAVSVAAGPLSLSLSGVTTNTGSVTLQAEGKLTLDQPVNTNNGSTMLGAAPGLVDLIALRDITQSTSHGNNGLIIGGSLYAESDEGSVALTAANHIGANDNAQGVAQTPGLVAGFAAGDFLLVNNNAGLTIGTVVATCGCTYYGIYNSGNVGLATTGAGAITVDEPINAGEEIRIAVAPGYGFTNNASNDPNFDRQNLIPITAGLDTSFSSEPIVILADGMSLSGGTSSAGFGPVILGPATLTTPVSLGTASTINPDGTTTGPLGLAQADINTITAGSLQIGYRDPYAGVSFDGPIDVASNIQINTNNGFINDGLGNSTLFLVTGGAVTESGGAITATGPNTLALGVIAGSAAMNQDNAVGTLAAYTDGANANFSFTNSGQALAVDTLNAVQAGVQIENGFPVPFVMQGSPSNPLAGITTANGNVAVTVLDAPANPSLATLAINQPIDAGTGSVTMASVGDLTIGAFGSVTANAITLATLGNFTNDAGPSALIAGTSGQWLVYSTNPANDNDGGLTPSFIQYAATYPVGTAGTPTSPAASGDGLLYSTAPTVTVDSVAKIYDGTTDLPTSAADYTIGGGFNGDSVAVVASGATGSYASANVGSGINVTLTGLTISATNANGVPVYGYGIVAADSGNIGTITPATLTAGLTGTVSKVYDGTTAATLAAANYTLSGIIGGDNVALNDPTSGSYASANAGTGIGVSVTGLTLSGAAARDYMLASTTASANIGTITPATLTASLTGTVSKTYDGTTTATLTAANYTLSGIIGSDSVALNDPTTGTYSSANVGTGLFVNVSGLALTGPAAANYTLGGAVGAAANIGTIIPATLTASIVGTPTKTYDGTTSATLVSGDFSLSGFVAGQGATVSSLTGSYNSPNVATATTVTASLIASDFAENAGTLFSNYTLPTTATGAGTITPATLTASIVGAPTKTYDGTTNASLVSGNFSLFGFIAGQGATVSPLTGTYNSANVATATSITANLVAGDFVANAGTLLSNYTLSTTATGAGTITPATLTASIVGAPTKTYDGTTSASLVSGNFSLSGFIAGQGATVSPLTGTYNSANVATVTSVTANLVAGDFIANAGTLLSNYTLPTTASGAGALTPAALTITAADLIRIFGEQNPPLSYSITSGSLLNGDMLSGGLITLATTNSPAGAYLITQGTLAASANYNLTFIDGILTVTPAPTVIPAPTGIVAPSISGLSPAFFILYLTGKDGPEGPGLTTCNPGSIAAALKGSGKASLSGGGDCGL
jgi:filamentous hemagglutinin family protein